jgi:hypothetical protein
MLRYGLTNIHDVACVKFYLDYIWIPEDGAPDAPKHVGAKRYSKYSKTCVSWPQTVPEKVANIGRWPSYRNLPQNR